MEEQMDDFGDLYTDVDVHVNGGIGIQLYIEEGNENESDPKVVLQSTSQSKSVDSTYDSGEKSDPKPLVFEAENENPNGENVSDSEDDLHIVLNEEDCRAFPHSRGLIVRNGAKVDGSHDEDDLVIVTEADQTAKDRKWVDQLQSPMEGLEHGSDGSERGNSSKGSYLSQYSQFKYVRPHATSFSSNMKTSGSGGVVSFPSPLSSRGDWNINGGSQCSGLVTSSCNIGIPAVVHNGFDFSLPRNRTILDVGIETFERKPWRHPGVDMTDFFNFGLDEESWKTYCKHMGQYRQKTTMLTKIPVRESLRTNQVDEVHDTVASEAVPGEIAQIGQGERISSDLENIDNRGVRRFAIPRGRAIQVEDGIGQRRSSMDIRRPRHRDSDVVIQIAVQDPMADSSSSGNEEPELTVESMPKVSENGDFEWEEGNQGMQHIGNACRDVLSSDCMNGCSRYSQPKAVYNALSVDHDSQGNEEIANLDPDNCAKVEEPVSKETSETLETTKYCKEVAEEIPSKSDTSMVLAESAFGSQIRCSLSPSDIGRHSEASKKVSVDMEKAHSHKKKPSSPSPLYHQFNDSRSDASNKEPEFIENNYRGQKQNYSRRSRLSVAELEIPMDNEKAFPQANRKDWYNRDHLTISHGTRKERRRDSSFDDREDLSYYRETEISIGYRSKRFAEKQIRRDGYTKFLHRKDYPHFREEMDTYFRRNWDEREYSLERDFSTRDNERQQRESYCQERGWNDQGMDDIFQKESKSVYKRSSIYTEKERYHLQRRKREDAHQLREGASYDDLVLEHGYREEFIQEKYGRDIPYSAREEEYIRERYGRHILYSEREMESSDRRDRYHHSPCFGIHSPWRSVENDGGHWRHPDLSPSPSQTRREFCIAYGRGWHDTSPPRSPLSDTWKSNERYVDYGKLPNPRDKYSKKDRGGGWFDHNGEEHHYSSYEKGVDIDKYYNDAGGRSVYPNDIVYGERRGPSWQSKARHWTDDEVSFRHGDRDSSHSPEISFQYERSLKHENSHIKHDSSHSEEFIDDHDLERDRNKIIWEGRRDSEVSHQIGSVSDIVLRGEHEQATLRCKESVNLHLNGCKRKFHGRYSKPGDIRCSRHDDRDTGHAIDMDKTAFRHSEEFYTGRQADFPSHSPKLENNYIHSISSKVERVDQHDSVHSTDHSNEKWFDKHPITQHHEISVLEEGQLLVEEPENKEVWTLTKKKPSSAVGACRSDNMEEKNKFSEDAGHGNKISGGYDQHRILESIAKMEKRRERFKEPIALKKEPENSPKPQSDLPVEEIAEVKQQRPARKRRWGGS